MQNSIYEPIAADVDADRRRQVQEDFGRHIVENRNRMAELVRKWIEADVTFPIPIYDRLIDKVRQLSQRRDGNDRHQPGWDESLGYRHGDDAGVDLLGPVAGPGVGLLIVMAARRPTRCSDAICNEPSKWAAVLMRGW
jgi:hypothetical protein